jgi:hypothetical protein
MITAIIMCRSQYDDHESKSSSAPRQHVLKDVAIKYWSSEVRK